MNVMSFLRDMIANELSDESVAQCICAFLADHPDSQSTEDFANFAASEHDTPDRMAAWMTIAGDDIDIAAWIASDDMDEFTEYAESEFGITIQHAA